MAVFKIVFQYTQQDKGFTEVFYRQVDNITTASTFSPAFRQHIMAFRPTLTVLRKARVSDVLNNRSSVVVNINRAGGLGDLQPDITGAAAIYTLNAPTIPGRRNIWIRGLADNSVQRNALTGIDEPSASITTGVADWIGYLKRGNYCVRALARLGVAPLIYVNVLSLQSLGAGSVVLTVPNTWNITASRRVILSQFDVKHFPGLNGHWTATPIDATHFSVPYNNPCGAGTFPLTKGRTRPEEYVYGEIDPNTSDFNRFGTRDTGRNPLGGRGRRSVSRIRSA